MERSQSCRSPSPSSPGEGPPQVLSARTPRNAPSPRGSTMARTGPAAGTPPPPVADGPAVAVPGPRRWSRQAMEEAHRRPSTASSVPPLPIGDARSAAPAAQWAASEDGSHSYTSSVGDLNGRLHDSPALDRPVSHSDGASPEGRHSDGGTEDQSPAPVRRSAGTASATSPESPVFREEPADESDPDSPALLVEEVHPSPSPRHRDPSALHVPSPRQVRRQAAPAQGTPSPDHDRSGTATPTGSEHSGTAGDKGSYARLMAWQRDRDRGLQRQRYENARATAAACTFAPTICRPPQPPPQEPVDTTEALLEAQLSDRSYPRNAAVEERLRQQGMRRDKRKAALVQRVAAAASEECTFSPEVHPSPTAVQARRAQAQVGAGASVPYLDLTSNTVETRATQCRIYSIYGSHHRDRDDPECTFRPVTGRGPDPARAAQGEVHERLYNQAPAVVSRRRELEARHATLPTPALSAELEALRVTCGLGRDGTAQDDAMGTFFGNVLGTDASELRLYDDDGEAPGDADAARATRLVRFSEFLERQNGLEERRQRRVAAVRALTDPPHRPTQCEQSTSLVRNRPSGAGTSRPDHAAVRAERMRRLAEAELSKCTFAPRITTLARSRAGRTAEDMHKDRERRAEAVEALQRRRLADEDADLSFAPALTEAPSNTVVRSGLTQKHIQRDYIRRVTDRQRARDERTRRAAQERSQERMEECTFWPKTSAVPEYISRMHRQGL